MPNIDLDLIKLSYDVKFPTIDFDVDIDVPKEIPKVGGKSWRLKSFSLNVAEPKITIPVDAEFFGGSVSVELDFARCEIKVFGEVSADVVVKKFRWHIGPEHVEYMKPLRLKEPSWSVHPQALDAAKLQAAVNNAPPPVKRTAPEMRNDDKTKAKIAELFIFHGAVDLIENLIKAAVDIAENMDRDAEGKPGASETKVDDSASERDKAAGADKAASSHGGGVLIGMGIGASGGSLDGIAGSLGFYVTTDRDYGCFGSVGIDAGAIVEISAGICWLFYFQDADKSALENFGGANFFVTCDVGEGLSLGWTLFWPEKKFMEAPTSASPCGFAVTLGAGGGLPLNFAAGSSQTWRNVRAPSSKKAEAQGN